MRRPLGGGRLKATGPLLAQAAQGAAQFTAG